MSYYFKKSESIAVGVIRIINEQVKIAKELLNNQFTDADNSHLSFNEIKSVYQARKCFKKIRSLLKLCKKILPKNTYQTENLIFRDCARQLAEMRDSDAVIETYDLLAVSYPELLEENFVASIQSFLIERKRNIKKENLIKNTKKVYLELVKSQKRIERWKFKTKEIDIFLVSYYECYKRGFDNLNKLKLDSDDKDFHEWRKLTKHHRAMNIFLSQISSSGNEIGLSIFNSLSIMLGQIQDCSVLIAVLKNEKKQIKNNNARMKIIEIATIEKNKIKADSLNLAKQAYGITPKTLIKEFEFELQPKAQLNQV